MRFKGFFVDDLDKIYASQLSVIGDNGLHIEYRELKEAATLAGEIFDARPDIVALDFRLDENPAIIDPKRAYNGSGLAQLLRDKASMMPEHDFPIVLISSEEKLRRFYRPDGTAHDLFDYIFKKDQAADDPEPVQKQLLSLCKGYVTLKQVWGGSRLSVFGLDDKELAGIAKQELRTGILSAGAPHIAARTILKDVIDRPGILLSDNELAARLGVATITPLLEILEKEQLLYTGIFNEGWRRWWAHRFEEWAIGMFSARPVTLTGSFRAKMLHAKLGIDVPPAKSSWNESPDERFAFSCAVCDRATEVRHSVAAFDPQAPRYSHRKRICWDCIQTEQYLVAKMEVDEVDANLVKEVMNKPRIDSENF